MAPVYMAAPTWAATGSEPGLSRPPSLSTASRSRSWVTARRWASTGLALASVNSTRPRRGSAELKPSTAAMPARVLARSEFPAPSIAASTSAASRALTSSYTAPMRSSVSAKLS